MYAHRSDIVVEVWARSVRCVARGANSNFFFGGSGEDDFQAVLFEALRNTRYQFFGLLVFLFIRTRVSLKTAHGWPQRWILRAGTRLGYIFIQVLSALRAVCRVSRVHVPYVKRCYFFSKEKKQAAGPNSSGATLSLKTRVPVPACVPLFRFPKYYSSEASF